MTRRLFCRVFVRCPDAALAFRVVHFRYDTYKINGADDSGTLPWCYISLNLTELEEYNAEMNDQALMNVSPIDPGEEFLAPLTHSMALTGSQTCLRVVSTM